MTLKEELKWGTIQFIILLMGAVIIVFIFEKLGMT